jgi:hypothetical protein
MHPRRVDFRIDLLLFLIGASAAVYALVKTDDEFLAGIVGLSAYVLLAAIYVIIARLISLPRPKLDDFLAAIVALLPW